MTIPSNADIYEKLGSIHASIENLRVNEGRSLATLEKHETRLSTLERSNSRQAGIIATISGPLALLVAFVYDFIGGLIR